MQGNIKSTYGVQRSQIKENLVIKQPSYRQSYDEPSQQDSCRLSQQFQNNKNKKQVSPVSKKIIQKSQLQQYLTFDYQSSLIFNHQLKNFSIIAQNDKDRFKYGRIFQQISQNNPFRLQKLQLSQKQTRLIGVIMGLGIGDALGSSTEFGQFRQNGYGIFRQVYKGFQAIQKSIDKQIITPRFNKYKPINTWTDDTSMALCLAYSLIIKKFQFQPNHVRCLYHLWWNNGLGNSGLNQSVGLGGNMALSLQEFQLNIESKYVDKGNQNNNGNGSLMRLAPVPIAFHLDKQKAMKVAQQQSLTTHNGLQAKQCCRLLTLIIINLINRKPSQDWKQVIKRTGQQFTSSIQQVKYLAQSKQETQLMFDKKNNQVQSFKEYNRSLKDRNWNWKFQGFNYSPCRFNSNPCYIGSYCMDALAMALHIVWSTNSFRECVEKAADMGGDSDTVGAIAGQIAGAIYGFNRQMFQLYSQMTDFTQKRYQLFLVSRKLIKNQSKQSDRIVINLNNSKKTDIKRKISRIKQKNTSEKQDPIDQDQVCCCNCAIF